MGLLSLFKQKQEAPEDTDNGQFQSRTAEESKAARGNGKRATTTRKNKALDPILPEKKRARRRLIGAVALVLAAVIGLPMLFDSEPKPLADDINIQIPSKDKPAVQASQNAREQLPEAGSTSVSENIKTPISEPVEEIIPPPATRTIAPSQNKEAPVSPNPEIKADAKSDFAPSAKAPGKVSQAKTIETAVSKTPAKSAAEDETSRALAILEGKTSSKPVNNVPGKADAGAKVPAHSNFVVQVAALATQEKINELQGKLKAANIASYTQTVITSSGKIIRIRIGPFTSRVEAEKTREKLIRLGLSGTVIPN